MRRTYSRSPSSFYKKRRKIRRSFYYKRDFDDLSPLEKRIVLIIGLLLLLWVFIIKPFIEWLRSHLLVVGLFILLFLLIGLGGVYIYRNRRKRFEEEQKAKGLVKFVDRFGNERWGDPQQVERWKKEDEEARRNEEFVTRVVNMIKEFKPAERYEFEREYQLELVGYLKSNFPNAVIEEQRVSSRPDIVIGDIAIEIKGPTYERELETIADKCTRYLQHFKHLIIVLFSVRVNPRRYNEWEEGIKRSFPNVTIIKK